MLMAAVRPAQLSQGVSAGRLVCWPMREARVLMKRVPSEILVIQNTLNDGSVSHFSPALSSQAARPAASKARSALASDAQTLADSTIGPRPTARVLDRDALR